MEKKRNSFIDIIKGTAVFFMIWGHTIQYFNLDKLNYYENIVFRFIYSFHMPLFMLVSGYLFYDSLAKYDLKQLIYRRLKNIGIPVLSWGIIEWIIFCLIDRKFAKGNLVFFIRGYWFLWAVLYSSIIVALIYQVKCNSVLKNILYMAGMIVIALIPFPSIMNKGNLFMYPYFVAGVLFHQYKKGIISVIWKIRYCFVVLFLIALYFFHERDYIYTSGLNPFSSEYGVKVQLKIDIFRYGIGFLGSIAIVVILYDIIKNEKTKIFLEKTAACIGVVSLQLYVVQHIVLEELAKRLYNYLADISFDSFFVDNVWLFSFLWSPLFAILFTVILYYGIRIVKKDEICSLILFGGR